MAGVSQEARERLRWRLADESDSAQQALFAEEAPTWRAGHGEFGGLEFLEVKAQRVINPVPPQCGCAGAVKIAWSSTYSQ